MVLRGALDYARAMVAHGTAARVQARLRQASTPTCSSSGPPTSRRPDRRRVLTVVEGVQQLETYFGQYLPQLFVAALIPPLLIFAFVAWLDVPIALVLLGRPS